MVLSFVQMPVKVSAAEVSAEAKALAGQLIKYYESYQESAQTDIERVLDEMEEIDPGYAEVWEGIMDYWTVVNTPGFANEDTVPEGLPTDDSLCIVILGFALNSDGTMKPELIGRLQAGLNVANQYPNAYVCVTGGGTASGNPNVTEGGLMGDWLLEQGLAPERLIRETRAGDTVGNARYTYDILSTTYPTVDKVVIVTSDYHIPRGSILYQSKFLTEAYITDGRKINVIDNSGNETGSNGYENLSLQVSGVASITGVSKASSVDPLSVLESFEARLVSPLSRSTELKVEVEATYNNGYKRDVTPYATISEIDPELGINQVISVSYEENGIALATSFNLSQGSAVASNYRANLAPIVEQADKIAVVSLDAASKEIFVPAYEAAKAMLENQYASEEQVKEALDALTIALANLSTKENIALNKTVTASHNQAGASVITNGNINDYYAGQEGSTNIPTEETEIVIDLYNTYALDAINVVPYWQTANRYYQYDVFTSVDNEAWDLVAEYRGTELTTSVGQSFVLETAKTARYIKIKGHYTYVIDRGDINNIHINEVFAYGEMVEENPVQAPVVYTGKRNVALGRPVTLDSTDGNVEPSVLTDGKCENVYTGSKNGAENAWAVVELDEITPLSSINVVTYSNKTTSAYYYYYEVLVSEDNEEWVKVGEHTGSNPGYKGTTFTFDTIDAKYVKVKGTGTTNNNKQFHLVEICAFEDCDNIALNKGVTVSQGANGSKITDGTTSGYWDAQSLPAYAGSGAAAWEGVNPEDRPYFVVDLDGLYEIDQFAVYNYAYGTGKRYYNYEIYTSLDGVEWTLFGAKTDIIDSLRRYEIGNKSTEARFVKFVATYHSANSGFHVIELEAFGDKLEEPLADYDAVETAIAAVPASLEGYSMNSVAKLRAAIKAVDYNVVEFNQATVDAYVAAINEAVAALEAAPADYSAVNESIAIAKAEKPYIIDYSAVQAALNAVVFGKDVTEQAVVNQYAVEINKAIANAEYTPKPMKNLVGEAVDYKTIKLTWDADAAATSYVIERQNTKTGKWISVATTTESTYTVAGVKTGKEYTYRVKGQRVFDSVTYESEFAEVKATATLVGTPELSVSQNGDAIFNLTWTQVAGATRYIVYRQANGGEWKKILTLGGDATTYTSANLKPGNYAYQVKAARYDGEERIMTEGSNTVEVEATVTAPVLERESVSVSSVSLKWNAVEGMKYYEVYATTNDVTRRVKVTTATTCKLSNLKSQAYAFKTRGYTKVNDQTIYTSFSNEIVIDFGNLSFE